ncbi:hypothetical protein BH11PSE11_BH11PSE11_13380 [soil metagenome]
MCYFRKFRNLFWILATLALASSGPAAATSAVVFAGETGACPTDITITSPKTISCSNPSVAPITCDAGQSISINAFGVTRCVSNTAPVCTLTQNPSPTPGNFVRLQASCNPLATSYVWSSNSGLLPSNASGDVARPTTVTVYTVAGKNNFGTGATVSVAVNPIQENAIPICSLTQQATTATTTLLTATCTPPATSYAWTNTGFSAGSKSGSITTPSVATTYSVQGSNAAGAGNVASITVQPAGVPICKLTQFPLTPTAISITASCSPAATSYAWVNTGFASTSSGGTITKPPVTTTYSVTGSNASGTGPQDSIDVNVGALPPPVCTLGASSNNVVAGNPITLTATCNPDATSFSWTNPTPASPIVLTPGGGNTAEVVIPLQTPAGVYTFGVVGQNAAGSDANRTTAITVSEPVASCVLNATPAAVGSGETVNLSANCFPVPATYAWSVVAGPGPAPGFTTASGVVNPTGTTTYRVDGSGGAFATKVVSVAAPTCSVTTSLGTLSTSGGASTLTATCSPMPTSYAWSTTVPGGSVPGSTASGTLTVPGGAAAGSYTVSVTGTNGSGAGNTANTPITLQAQGASYCPGGNTGMDSGPIQNIDCPINLDPRSYGSRACTINLDTEAGQNFVWSNSRGQSTTTTFTSGSIGRSGNFILEAAESLAGMSVDKFINISKNQCDFSYTQIDAGSFCSGSAAKGALQYKVEPAGSPPGTNYCSLLPNTTYYVNIRNEAAAYRSVRGQDTCPANTACGFLFGFH